MSLKAHILVEQPASGPVKVLECGEAQAVSEAYRKILKSGKPTGSRYSIYTPHGIGKSFKSPVPIATKKEKSK